MGSYRSDDEALIGLARQLTDAYGEARTREDQDYACESIAQYLVEFRDVAPGEALLAILDLPLTAETYPLVDEAQVALAGRGPVAVRLLLEAALGEVYDPDGPAPERAAETIDSMDPGEVSLGLCEVLCGDADGQLKGAALDALVALGGVAEPDLVATLDDPVGGEWAAAALEQLRYVREHGDPLAEESEEWTDEAGGDLRTAAEQEAETGNEPAPAAGDDQIAAGSGEARGAGPDSATGPDKGVVDEAFDEFRRRFDQEAGADPTSP